MFKSEKGDTYVNWVIIILVVLIFFSLFFYCSVCILEKNKI